MSKWIAAIGGNEADLAELEKSLVGPALRISKQFGAYVLESEEFSSETDPESVRRKAGEILDIVSGASRLAFGLLSPLSLGWVATVGDDGSKYVFVGIKETVSVRDTVSVVIARQDGTVEKHEPAGEVPKMTSVAKRDSSVAETLRLLAKGDNNWVNLYRIYEVVAKDVGGDEAVVKTGWATRASLRQFKHTANSPGAIGHEARHGVDPGQPPVSPMSLPEAKSFVRGIMQKWLRSKV